jgi:hypothetical protein
LMFPKTQRGPQSHQALPIHYPAGQPCHSYGRVSHGLSLPQLRLWEVKVLLHQRQTCRQDLLQVSICPHLLHNLSINKGILFCQTVQSIICRNSTTVNIHILMCCEPIRILSTQKVKSPYLTPNFSTK